MTQTTTATPTPAAQASPNGEPTTALVPAPRGGLAEPLEAGTGNDVTILQGAMRRRVWTNLDLASDEGLALAMLCEGEGGRDFASAINETIQLRAVYVHDWQKVGEDGEVAILQRIVLIDEGGQTFACSSSGVMDSLRVLIGAKGRGPWSPPLPVKLLQIQFKRSDTGEPGRIFKLQYVAPVKATARGKK